MLVGVDLTSVGATLRRQREARKLSVREAADRASISRQTMSDLEAGKHPPGPATQRGIAAWLGWDVDWYDRLLDDLEPVTISQPGDADVAERVQLLQREVAALSEVVLLLAMDVEDERRGALDELLDAIREVRSDVDQQPQAG
jgi:transcriptional regulator with XRE-family HTH domain